MTHELSKEDLHSMIAKGIVEHAKTSDELTAVKAELAELRKEFEVVDNSETDLIEHRDELQKELQDIEIVLGGNPNFAEGDSAMRLAQEAAGQIEAARKAIAELHHTCFLADAQFAETHRQLVQATFELAELRKERDELRAAVLRLGELDCAYADGNEIYLTWWNTLVAKLRAEKGEAKATKETEP